ncbi:uncharacterized protein LOC113117792 isoform X1 [Carassius auratus]|uniref:Uncharacterized protein LOC113117792 isoform X1 n=1 Tax=Carassius auratus TaxID=7957 RepID=A0A6P6RBG8_CARAU|nr:uncharacterized protein LOC113117792 isoform X1 [Carassius auratus]
MTLSLGIMSGKKQNLLLLMIICCALCQISTRCTSVVDTCQINFITSSSGLSNGACKVTPIKSSPVTLQGSSDNLIIQVNSSDQCFWNSSSSTVPDIKRTCLSKDEETITLNISSLVSGQCKLYSFNITKDNAKQEIRMNETVEGIKLWSVSNGCIKHINNYFQINCIPSSSCKFSDVYLSNDNQITSTGSSDNLIIQVNSSDHCFWNRSSSTAPDIKWTCLSDDEETITLNISSLDSGQCRSYSFSIKKDHGNYEIRMNETVEAITLWLVPNRCIKNTTTYHQSSCINSSSGIFSDVYLSNDNPITYTGCGYSKSEEKCTNLVYNQDICRENEGSKYILKYNQNNEWTCVTCFDGSSTTITPPSHTTTTHNPTTSFTPHNTIQNPSTRLTSQTTTQKPTTNFTSQSTTPGYTDPAKASEALDKLGSKLEEMEKNNTSNAAIVMGDVIGLVHVQAKNTETKEINICYSSDQAMVVVNQSDMNTNCSWSTKISKEALNKSRLVNNGTAFVGVLRFYNMTNKNEKLHSFKQGGLWNNDEG